MFTGWSAWQRMDNWNNELGAINRPLRRLVWRRGQSVQDIADRTLDLLFPPRCASCRKSGSILCAACLQTCKPITPPMCLRCGLPLPAPGLCRSCKFYPPGLSGLRAAYIYQDVIKECIHALKYDGNRRLAGPLGALLARAYREFDLRADMIVPVPLHSERQRLRGYNHARLLAEVCAASVGVPLRDDVLIRTRNTAAQAELTAGERRQNMAGAFRCLPAWGDGGLYGYSILLIDDVCTTKSTLEECAAPLFAAGAASVWALVLARRVHPS
jgi:ComF family protein